MDRSQNQIVYPDEGPHSFPFRGVIHGFALLDECEKVMSNELYALF